MTVNIYILRAHFVHKVIIERYEHFVRDFGEDNVFILMDTTKLNEDEIEHRDWYVGLKERGIIITINEELACQINPIHCQFKDPGMFYRAEASLVHLYRTIKKDFDYLWFIEYDVHCRGSFAKALEPCHQIPCDFLSKGGDDRTKIRIHKEHRSWVWWKSLYGNVADAIKLWDRQGCFFPVNRFSVAMLKAIEENLGQGTGFCEVYFPCLCLMKGLTYEPIPDQVFGVFNFRPVQKKDLIDFNGIPDKLYHPVKG